MRYDTSSNMGTLPRSLCNVCLAQLGDMRYVVREMMFGTRHQFHYAKCTSCGSSQLENIPDDWSTYYPHNYYSLSSEKSALGTIRRHFRSYRSLAYFGSPSPIGVLLKHLYPNSLLELLPQLVRDKSSRVLDVGCGTGALLFDLRRVGFSRLYGCDPYIDEGIRAPGVLIVKAELHHIAGEFDLIVFNHSLEHVSQPRQALYEASARLAARGRCLVRVPLGDSYAAEYYKENWVQHDAPRHLFIYTRKAMDMLARSSGLVISDVIYDSTEFQFIGSELYRQDRPLTDYSKYLREIGRQKVRMYRCAAQVLNLHQAGDQAAFILEKSS